MKIAGCINEEKNKKSQKKAVGKSGSYVGNGVAIQQAAGYYKHDRPAIRHEPAENGGKEDQNNCQKIQAVFKEDRRSVAHNLCSLGLYTVV